ncbi:MAG TPA: RHS repeat-associated core domain-containing protein [Ktedonobacterales bacterium]|nr:RHS repeat-associated core domain-containing protein [Ktedonobacterales bacterium]
MQPSYDAASNVIGVTTTLTTGTDTQAFCYDALNRLTWAGATGTPPCGGSLTAGSLTSAQYTQTFTYDTLNRLTSGPAGSYTYGDSSHPDAATSIGSAYTAAYDAVGNMTCRAPTASQTCAGTPTGATLTYDNEGRLATWQNTPSSPTTTDSFLYDGEGNRIEQVVQQSGVGETDTVYVGGLEEVTTTTPTGGQPTTSTTVYYGGLALAVNSVLSFLVSDGLGTATEALTTSGQVSASRLYTPYGSSRYASGTFPTDQGFTGYRNDTATGLDYANARYYDPAAGQFGSADPSGGSGLNGFGYVGGNPETATDPSGLLPTDCFDGGDVSAACVPQAPSAPASPGGDGSAGSDGGEAGSGGDGSGGTPGTPDTTVSSNAIASNAGGPGGGRWSYAKPGIIAAFIAVAGVTVVVAIAALLGGKVNKASSASPTAAPNWSLAKAAEMADWKAREASQPKGCTSSDCGGGGGGGVEHGGGEGATAPEQAPSPNASGSGARQGGGGKGCSDGGGSSGDGTTWLYHVSGPRGTDFLLKFGDYGLTENQSGLYFAFTQEGAADFMNSSFNAGKPYMMMSRVQVPSYFLTMGVRFYDPKGGGDSIHFSDEAIMHLDDVIIRNGRSPEIIDSIRLRNVC